MSTVLNLSGALSLDSASRVAAQIGPQLVGGNVVLDMQAVTEVDSTAIALLLAWQRSAQAAQHKLSVRHAPPSLSSLAQLYGVAELLPRFV